MKGRNIETQGSEIFYVRHAQSYANAGIPRVDSPLTDMGIDQAKLLDGDFDLVILSPMRRCQETLHYSNITYKNLYISNNLRERIFNETDNILLEKHVSEPDLKFFARCEEFNKELENFCKYYRKILIVGHSYYFNAWYLQGCYPSIRNAEIIKLTCDL